MSFEDTLADTIQRGIETSSPHAGLTGSGVFAGSFDWHSCVHAHWALASLGRTRGRPELRRYVEERLPLAALEAELRFLDRHPAFEKPYGRAWFALLLQELSRTRSDVAPVLRRMRSELRTWLESSPFPEGEDGVPLATHDSWLFALFLHALAGPDATASSRSLLEERVLPHRDQIRERRYRDVDFLDLGALLATLRMVLGEKDVESHLPFVMSPEDPAPAAGCGHACGRAALALWPEAAAAARGDEAASSRYAAGWHEFGPRPELWRDDFAAVSHWVPQFLWMARWLRDDRP